MSQQNNAVKIVCCYAHQDEDFVGRLKGHLSSLQRRNLINLWHDRDINAGKEWDQEIKKHLTDAQIFLLLISPDFIRSDYCYSTEMQYALEQHKQGSATVIPVILRPTHGWKDVPPGDIRLGKLQALPKDARAVTDWRNRDAALKNVAEEIERVINASQWRSSINPPIAPPQPSQEQVNQSTLLPDSGTSSSGAVLENLVQDTFSTSSPNPKIRRPRKIFNLLMSVSILLLCVILVSAKFLFFQASSLSAYDNAVTTQGIQFGFDAAHTRFNPYEQTLNTSNVSKLKELGSFLTGNKIFSSPEVSGGVLYIASWDGFLYALDAKCNGNCKRLWSFHINTAGDNHVDSSPAVVNNVVYIGSDNGAFYAFSTTCQSSSCDPLWSSPPLNGGALWSSPTVAANGRIYVGSWNGTLSAFHTTCRSSDCSTPEASFTVANTQIDGTAVADGKLYVSSNNGKLYALDANCRSKCQPLWTATTGGALSSPAVANGVVYVGSQDHSFYAFPANCSVVCQPLWKFPAGGNVSSSPAVANGMVYVGSDDHKLYAFPTSCRSTCSPRWIAATEGSINSSPIVANGVVYVGSQDHSFYAFPANCSVVCQPLWKFPTGGNVSSSPTVANGMVYVGSDDQKVYAFGITK